METLYSGEFSIQTTITIDNRSSPNMILKNNPETYSNLTATELVFNKGADNLLLGSTQLTTNQFFSIGDNAGVLNNTKIGIGPDVIYMNGGSFDKSTRLYGGGLVTPDMRNVYTLGGDIALPSIKEITSKLNNWEIDERNGAAGYKIIVCNGGDRDIGIKCEDNPDVLWCTKKESNGQSIITRDGYVKLKKFSTSEFLYHFDEINNHYIIFTTNTVSFNRGEIETEVIDIVPSIVEN